MDALRDSVCDLWLNMALFMTIEGLQSVYSIVC